jgi:hypothetical protein
MQIKLLMATCAVLASTGQALAQTKRAAEIKVSDVTSLADAALAFIPKLLTLMSAVLLIMLLWKSIKTWKTMSLMELAAVVIAFAIVAGAR